MTNKICFVIQPFSETYKNRYKSVYEPAIKDAGLISYRTGGHSVDDIPEDIRRRIREAHICFADITEDRPNVWYEVGFAHACNKQVVMVCDEEERPSKNLPFDISVRNVLFYEGKQVDSKKFYRDGVIKDIVERVKARAEEADSDITTSPVTAQQSQNSDNSLTSLDRKVLKVIFQYRLVYGRSLLAISIATNIPDEKKNDVLISIDKMEFMGYIEKDINFIGEFLGYILTGKGRRWYHENFHNQPTHSTSSGNDATG